MAGATLKKPLEMNPFTIGDPLPTPTADWQDPASYDYTRHLAAGPWAWEFLRRNEDYRHTAAAKLPNPPDTTLSTLAPPCLGSLSEPDGWGLVAFANPGCSARTATVLWQPNLYDSVLPLTSMPDEMTCGFPMLDLGQLACRIVMVPVSDRVHHIFLGDEERWLQLMVHGTSSVDRLHLVTQAIVRWPSFSDRHQLLKRLSYVASHGCLAPHLYRPHAQAERLSRVLQALDGAFQGASQREIALSLVGRDRVARDWNDPRGHLRDHVRRAVQRGRFLTRAGYLHLLKSRAVE